MAKNDYSRRSSKDVFWGDDNNNKNISKSDELEELFRQSEALEQQKEQTPTPHEPSYEPSYEQSYEPSYEPEIKAEVEVDNPNFDYDSIVVNETETETPPPYEPQNVAPPQNEPSDITPPPYIPPQKKSSIPPPTKKKEDALEGFDVEKYIKDNSSNFSTTILTKIISQGLCVFLLLKWLFNHFGHIGLVVLVSIIAYWVIELIYNGRYSSYISLAIKSIKNVTAFNKTPKQTMEWATMFKFPYSSVNNHVEDELIIEVDEITVTSQEMQFLRRVGKSTETIMMCECYRADMEGRTSFADNITLVKGKMPFVKRDKYNRQASQYLLYSNDDTCLDQCNTPRLLAIADRVAAHLGNKAFVMSFTSQYVNLATPIAHMDKFDYNFFDYTIEDRIRRDVSASINRVQIANLLAEN